jgi:hypothetical protein
MFSFLGGRGRFAYLHRKPLAPKPLDDGMDRGGGADGCPLFVVKAGFTVDNDSAQYTAEMRWHSV